MENYICINGKKAELTEEQMKALGIELPKPSPFERVTNTANTFYEYYYIADDGQVHTTVDSSYSDGKTDNDLRFRIANYCTDGELLEQRALRETLSRLLWRYSMMHNGDKINFDDRKAKFYIAYSYKEFAVRSVSGTKNECTYFYDEASAYGAIKEIIEPFMKAHPEFKI